MRRKLIAECIGTFALVFAGTGAMVIDEFSGGGVSHVGVSLVFGLIVTAMIYSLGDVSGAHINPAVTLGFWAARRIPGSIVLPYILSQLAGALAASLSLRALFSDHGTLGMTLPAGSDAQAFGLEIALTATLMFVILSVSTGPRDRRLLAGIVIGGTVALSSLWAGPICGASMNPARSFGPALASGQLGALWIYFAAPALGALLAVGLCCSVHERDCCRPMTEAAASSE